MTLPDPHALRVRKVPGSDMAEAVLFFREYTGQRTMEEMMMRHRAHPHLFIGSYVDETTVAGVCFPTGSPGGGASAQGCRAGSSSRPESRVSTGYSWVSPAGISRRSTRTTATAPLNCPTVSGQESCLTIMHYEDPRSCASKLTMSGCRWTSRPWSMTPRGRRG
jgi:hypothetical protein